MTDFYFDLYEKLYQDGYHSDLSFSHFESIEPFVMAQLHNRPYSTILDVGCSHGLVVQKLINMGHNAYGIDVSNTAIEKCKQRGLTTCKLASVTETPFDDNMFDLIISTDMLEHLLPEDVSQAVTELRRICKGKCLFSIACDPEGNKTPLQKLHNKNQYTNLTTLHTTLMPPDEWNQYFYNAGFDNCMKISYNNDLYIVIYE